jgi:hypothetical protein
MADSVSLFQFVDQGHDLTATVLLRPTSGDVISVDLHAFRDGDVHVALLRLAGDVAEPAPPRPEVARPAVTCEPASDVAFRGYVDLALSRMAEPTPEALALRLRRLYPHARVVVAEAMAGSAEEVADARWTVRREADAGASSDLEWWVDPGLPRVRYDRNALILEANDAARGLLGDQLVGHHWQEFVTPGSTDEVAAMLTILAEVGRAESRFRMPRADGSLLEFDSWTEVDGDGFTTVMRPRG